VGVGASSRLGLRDDECVRIRIVGMLLPGRECGASGDFPGYSNIHVGVQRRNRRAELLDLHPGDAATAVWTFDCAVHGTDLRGPTFRGPRVAGSSI
jgi:hypothetical protein